jgi:hypothetical protein
MKNPTEGAAGAGHSRAAVEPSYYLRAPLYRPPNREAEWSTYRHLRACEHWLASLIWYRDRLDNPRTRRVT